MNILVESIGCKDFLKKEVGYLTIQFHSGEQHQRMVVSSRQLSYNASTMANFISTGLTKKLKRKIEAPSIRIT